MFSGNRCSFETHNNGKYIIVPEGVRELKDFAFYTNSKLEKVSLPSTLRIIAGCAFMCCGNLERITIPEGVEVIDGEAFNNCSNLKFLNLPSTLKKIGACVFFNCKSLEYVSIPEGVLEIGDRAFEGCTSLKFLNLPKSLKKIGEKAFNDTKLDFIILPPGITEIGWRAFESYSTFLNQPQKKQYIVSKHSYAERYLKSEGLKYELLSKSEGLLAEASIMDGVLYYIKSNKGKIEVPSGVEVIDSYAASEQDITKEIILSDSVKEIRPYAFFNCNELENVRFGGNIERIGSKAFVGLKNQIVELPKTIKEIAPDAFGEGCVLSVGGEMPFYFARRAELETTRYEIEAKERLIVELREKKQTLETGLESYVAAMPQEFAYISQYKEQVLDIKKRREVYLKDVADRKNVLESQIKQLEIEKRELLQQRKKCFFLAISKKNALDESIQKKEEELQLLQSKQIRLAEEKRITDHSIMDELRKVETLLETTLSEQAQWEEKKQSHIKEIAAVETIVCNHTSELTKMKSLLEKEEKALEQEHLCWQLAKVALTRRQTEKAFLNEKVKLLKDLNTLKYTELPTYIYEPRKAIVEEEMLNMAFLEMIHDWNCEKKVVEHNSFVEKHQKDIERVKKLNLLLGCAENDDISQYCLLEEPTSKEKYLPERFAKLSACFAKTEYWKIFKQSSKEIVCAKHTKTNLRDKFFVGSDYICVEGETELLLLFPYCMVKCVENKPLVVFTYDNVVFTLECTEKIDTFTDIPLYGEFIREQYMHINKNGTISRKYSYNPIVKTIRFTTATIKDTCESFSFPFHTYQAAVAFETAFNNYRKLFTEGAYCDAYKAILQSADLEVVEAEFLKHAETEKKRIEEEKRRAEEEKRRIEEERLAAQAAAEEKRRALIQRQKEHNEERKRQAAEKQRIYSMFEETPSAKEVESKVGKVASALPVEIVSNCLISNNVFKVKMRQTASFFAEYATCYFVSLDGTIISNQKKLLESAVGTENTVGFILVSGIDYTQMQSCLLRIETNGTVFGEIAFKMSISFYSDF